MTSNLFSDLETCENEDIQNSVHTTVLSKICQIF